MKNFANVTLIHGFANIPQIRRIHEMVTTNKYSTETMEIYAYLEPVIMLRAMEKIEPNWPGIKEHQEDTVGIMRTQELGLSSFYLTILQKRTIIT